MFWRLVTQSRTVLLAIFHDGDQYASKAHLPYIIISLSVFLFTLLPMICVIALYPIKAFRELVAKCCHHQLIVTLNFFVEKYYFCFKDFLGGGRDQRSFASAYFWIVLLSFVAISSRHSFFLLTILFVGYSFVILIVQPYKKRHEAVVESLIFANLVLVTALFDRNLPGSSFHLTIFGISIILPLLGLAIYICYQLLKKLFSNLSRNVSLGQPSFKVWMQRREKNNQLESREEGSVNSSEEPPLPDRVVHPQLYSVYQRIDGSC